MGRITNKFIAILATRFPKIADRLIQSYQPIESGETPWTPFSKALEKATISLVTTAGVHHPDQNPFNMKDPDGDPTFRIIDPVRILSAYTITHDYYDHRDADRDLNIVFPMERLMELQRNGRIGKISQRHFSFMGHIDKHHIETLTSKTVPMIAEIMLEDGVDAALFTPG